VSWTNVKLEAVIVFKWLIITCTVHGRQ